MLYLRKVNLFQIIDPIIIIKNDNYFSRSSEEGSGGLSRCVCWTVVVIIKLILIYAFTSKSSYTTDYSSYRNDYNLNNQRIPINNNMINKPFVEYVPKICSSNECYVRGLEMRSNINPSVDPCDDFYEFSCGGWKAKHKIPDDKSKIDIDSEVKENIDFIIKSELSRQINQNDSKTVNYAKQLYKSCIDNGIHIKI